MGTSDRRTFIDSFLKMNTTTWLALVIAVTTLATPGGCSEPRVVCYYTNWSVYRPGTARFNPQNINPYLCTHLVYAFGGFTKDNTFKPFDKYQDIEKGGYAKFTGLKTYNKNLKTMLAIGGWNEGSTRFSPMVASRERRKEFVRNAIKFLRQNRFDGLDLDWEYPAFRDGGKPKDRENYAKLVRELREEFEREAEKTGRPRLLLTMAVPAGIEYIQKGFDVKTLNQYLDWMNLLTYDYHSAFEPAVNHHAPLYPLEEPNEYSVDSELNIDYTIKFYIENGADPDKLVLGIPTYGRSYTLFNADAVEIGSPADGPGEQGDATREKGYLAYYEICEGLKPKAKKRSTSDEDSEEGSEEEEEDEPWNVVHPNPKAMGPVAYKGNQWVGYDDVEIVKKKAEYVAENGLGGIMFWSIDNDDFRGNCHGKPYPLIEAAKEAYIVKLGSTDNAIDKPKSVTTPRTSSRRRNRPKTSTSTTTTVKPSAAAKANKRKSSSSVTSTTPTWNIVTPEPPTTPDPGSDFKCKDEGFFQHPRDCKKYFWCLDSGPSNLGIVAHQFTCPSGLFFNKAADSCDFSRNVLCKLPGSTTKAPATKAAATTSTSTTTRRPVKLSTKSSVQFRTTSTTTPEPEVEEEYEDEAEDTADIEAEDPRVIKELIDLIKKVGGVEQLEKHLHLTDTPASTDGTVSTTPSSLNIKLKKVLERTRGKTRLGNKFYEDLSQNSRRGPQNAGLESSSDTDKLLRKDRPQYTTIQRSRASSSTTEEPLSEEDSGENTEVASQQPQRARAVEAEGKVATTTKPLQYVNIRRARPSSDTADDTASRNALFERPESFIAVSDTPSSLDIGSARRENMPEYVTIKRQRPTTEEATTVQYQTTEQEVETQETALEREISSPSSQPQYTSIARTRSSTLPPEELNSPEPTTVLAVQISSLLNSASSSEIESPETTVAEATEADPTTTTTTTTTPAPSSSAAPTRRTVLRRRGSTTTTTPASTTTQTAKRNFLRRTKSTGPPDTTETDATIDTTTSKYTRRGISKFKSRKDNTQKEIAKKEIRTEENGENQRRPYLNGSAARSERPTRNFVRRRLGGANATSSSIITSPAPPPASPLSRRPFRVASRRRPGSTSSTTTTEPPNTEPPTTAQQLSEESLQDVGDTDAIEDPSLQERAAPKTPKIQRRPLTSLKDEDQNPSATNEDERKKQSKTPGSGEEEKKRQSKKYSSSFKQNQLDEVLRQKAKSHEEMDVTTEGKATRDTKSEEIDVTTLGTTIDDYSAETALAIAAHQLLAAPLPSVPNFEEEYKPTKKSIPQTTHEYKFTSPEYTEVYTDGKTYSDVYTSTPIYKTTATQEYIPTSTLQYSLSPSAFNALRTTTSTYVPSKSTYPQSVFTARVSRPTGFSTPNILSTLGPTTSTFATTRGSSLSGDRSTEFPRGRTTFSSALSGVTQSISPTISTYSETRGSSPEFIRVRSTYTPVPQSLSPTISTFSETAKGADILSPSTLNSQFSRVQSTVSSGYLGVSQNLSPSSSRLPSSVASTARYLGSSEKLIPVPVEDYSLAPEGYTGLSQEPAYFTREYLLESPVTKTYDDEYQYLSPVTTTQTTTRKLPKKTVYRRISTTHRPTAPSATTPKPRRAQPAKPFEKVPLKKAEPLRKYKPIENYDYYDDSHEKFADKYEEGTKVVVHGKGTIECLDIGNFPHPTSCKKFISCARLENGSLLGWEYACPRGLSFDPVGGICNWSAGLGCDEKDL